jgi:ribonuclease HI
VSDVVAKQENAVVLPREMFAHTLEHPSQYPSLTTGSARMVRYDKPDEILIYTSGQAIVTDGNKKRAGCAVIYETEDNPMSNPVAFSLEKEGLSTPFAAALRALLAALELKTWGTERWKQVVIATDDMRVYRGITHDITKWASKGWLEKGSKKHPPRPELWRRALDLINEQASHGCEVKFLLVTAEQNQHAAELARKIAPGDTVSQHYQLAGDAGCTFKAELEAGE